ncbi:MAG: hypothetical protein ACKV2T_30960 [Kofleriaceae bacterium]
MTRIAFVAVSLSLALVGCRDGGGGGDDEPGMDGGSNAGDVTIQEIQNDAMAPGTTVEVRGVVITAIDTFGSRTGDLFVSEPEGGPFSGVKVFGASLSDVAMLQVGDLVDITGAEKHEACTEAAPCGPVVFENGAGLTEIQGDTQGSLVITKVGTGTLPTPSVVDAKAMAAMPSAARIAEWEKWEGVMINVTNARQLSAVSPFGSNPGVDSTEFRITGVARVQSVLMELPTTAVAGTCYDSVTGVGDFFFNYLVLPRTAADLVGSGAGCNPMAESISALQTATTVPEFVRLTDVFVTAVANNKKNFWVSTSATAAVNEGVQVLRCSGSTGCNQTAELPAEVVVGRKVTVLGAGEEFAGTDNMGASVTQVSIPNVTASADAVVTVTPATPPTIEMLTAAATGEPYEGVLVRLQNVKLTALGTSSNSYTSTLSVGGQTFDADDDIYRFTAGLNTCYSSMIGIWTYNPFIDKYTFQPRANGAMVDGTVASNQTDCD